MKERVSKKNAARIPRLIVDTPARGGESCQLPAEAGHYVRNVMRLQSGDALHVVVANVGLFEARIELERREVRATLGALLEAAVPPKRQVHLFFSPLKQHRLHFLVEKAVELGVTALRPIVMDRSAVRDVNLARLQAVVGEAMEQSERLWRPEVASLESFGTFIKALTPELPLYVLLERATESPALADVLPALSQDVAILVGPEGGFSSDERVVLTQARAAGCLQTVSLGTEILRAETAALAALSVMQFSRR